MAALFYVLCTAFAVAILPTFLFGALYFKNRGENDKRHDGLVRAAMLTGLVPLFLALAFAYVFLSGGSNVAQFSSDGYLWSLWFDVWLLSILSVPVAFLFSLAALFRGPSLKNHPYSFWCRLFSVLSFFPTFYVLRTTMPDA